MILVLLGTQNNDFHRLLDEVERNIEIGNITEEVVVQAGFTRYNSNNMKIFDLTSKDDLRKLIDKANFVITHAGVGSIELSLEARKKVIVVPRKKKYGEHVNDHQKEIEREFKEKGFIIGIDDVKELEFALKKIEGFIPKKYKKINNENLIKLIKKYIDKMP